MKSPYSLKFHPDVEKDLLQASSWYQQKMIGLGLGGNLRKLFSIFYYIIKENSEVVLFDSEVIS